MTQSPIHRSYRRKPGSRQDLTVQEPVEVFTAKIAKSAKLADRSSTARLASLESLAVPLQQLPAWVPAFAGMSGFAGCRVFA